MFVYYWRPCVDVDSADYKEKMLLALVHPLAESTREFILLEGSYSHGMLLYKLCGLEQNCCGVSNLIDVSVLLDLEIKEGSCTDLLWLLSSTSINATLAFIFCSLNCSSRLVIVDTAWRKMDSYENNCQNFYTRQTVCIPLSELY